MVTSPFLQARLHTAAFRRLPLNSLRSLRWPLRCGFAITTVATALGLRAYWERPQGGFLYTPQNFCKAVATNSFTTTYSAIVFGCMAIVAVFTLLAFVPVLVRPRSVRSSAFRSGTRSGLVLLAFLGVASFLPLVAERMLPIEPWPGCHPSSTNVFG